MRRTFAGYAGWALGFAAWIELATLGMVLALAGLAIFTYGDRAFGDLPEGTTTTDALPGMVVYTFTYLGFAQLPALAAIFVGHAYLRYRGIDTVRRRIALLACACCAVVSVAFYFSALAFGGRAIDLLGISFLLAVPWIVTGAVSGVARGQTR